MTTNPFDELELHERRRVWWAFFWRGLVITACSTIGGALAGAVIGFFAGIVVGLLHYDVHAPGIQLLFKVLGGLAGFAVGVALSWQYVRWIFGVRLGGFRLALIRENRSASV
jgi:uncharacterized membrane protein YjjP (DUF1212 family)